MLVPVQTAGVHKVHEEFDEGGVCAGEGECAGTVGRVEVMEAGGCQYICQLRKEYLNILNMNRLLYQGLILRSGHGVVLMVCGRWGRKA
jgi:hypothetical protein